MPAAKPATGKKTRRAAQCVYTEGNRRCKRSGTGNPPLCHPHKIAFAETAKAAEPRKFGAGIADLLERVVNGRKINRKVLEDVAEDVAWWVNSGAAAQQPSPDAGGHGGRSGPFRPPSGFPFPPGWRPAAPKPPPVDPRIADKKRAKLRARIVLGFTPTEAITADLVKERRKALARAHHPDKKGGSTQKMQEINGAADILLAADL